MQHLLIFFLAYTRTDTFNQKYPERNENAYFIIFFPELFTTYHNVPRWKEFTHLSWRLFNHIIIGSQKRGCVGTVQYTPLSNCLRYDSSKRPLLLWSFVISLSHKGTPKYIHVHTNLNLINFRN